MLKTEFAILQFTKGTDLWLHETDKNVRPNLPLLFRIHKQNLISWFLGKLWKLLQQMSDFKAKIH